MNRTIDTVLFDLDGTLLDTYKDLCSALNVVLVRHDRPALEYETLRPFVSKGAMVMVCLAFGCRPESPEAKRYWECMLQAYREDIATHTVLFPDMDVVLKAIQDSGRKWGIVTNKPGYLTDSLLKTLALEHSPQCLVSGDTLPEKKPSPLPLLHACRELGGTPSTSVYIGDDERDVLAGRNAGMLTVAATYGYYAREDSPVNWGADYLIDHPSELLSLLSSRNHDHSVESR